MVITEKKVYKNNIPAGLGPKAVLVQCFRVRPLQLGSVLQSLAAGIPMARKEARKVQLEYYFYTPSSL